MGIAQAMIRRVQGRNGARGSVARGPVTLSRPEGAAAEAYRALRTNLLHDALVDVPGPVLALVSPGSRKSSSAVCANLGVALAQAGRETLILDCDLRTPALHETFGLREPFGIEAVLADGQGAEAATQEPVEGLRVISGGPSPPDATELLESRRFAGFLRRARGAFDHVLLDAPPLDRASDAAILGALSDGVLLVVDYRRTGKREALRAMRSLTAVRANVLGTVLANAGAPRGA